MKNKYMVSLLSRSELELLSKSTKDYFVHHFLGDIVLVTVVISDDWSPEALYRREVLRFLPMSELKSGEDGAGVLRRATEYTASIMPPRIIRNEHIASLNLWISGRFMEPDAPLATNDRYIESTVGNKKWGRLGSRLTTTAWVGGAVAAFYPGVLARLSFLMGEDMYVTFPNHNEARIHRASAITAEEVRQLIINSNNIERGKMERDCLSNNVFRYCSNRDELQVVEFYEW